MGTSRRPQKTATVMFSLLSRFTSAFHGLAMLVGKKINWAAISGGSGPLNQSQMSGMGYISYSNKDGSGVNNFDGQGSGDDFYGTMWNPPIGWVNNTDGGRSVLFPDYKQA